ncbi:MAG: hypothetical protein AAFP13_14355 [Pseudomonadota bacterium]
MYAPPDAPTANAELWAHIRHALPFEAPEELTVSGDRWQDWEHPELLFSQACGLPVADRLRGKVHLVASPDFGLAGCKPGYYHSTVVTRAGESPAEGMALAYNSAESQSGWGAAQGLGFVPALASGAHVASMAAVAAGRADVALIDTHTLRLHGLPEGLATHGTTPPTPAPPFITAYPDFVEPLRQALAKAIRQASAARALGLEGIMPLPLALYEALPVPPPPAP